MFHVADSLKQNPSWEASIVRVKNFLACGIYKYYPLGPVNYFVKRCLLRWGIDSPPLASKTGGLLAVHDPMSTVFTMPVVFGGHIFSQTWNVHQGFRCWAKQCVVTLVQCCAFGPFGRGLHSTEDKILGVCDVEKWSWAQEYKFEKWCSMSAIYGGRVYFLYRKCGQCSYYCDVRYCLRLI